VTLREDEIRPNHLKKVQADRYAADVRRLLTHRPAFTKAPCPACGHDEVRPEFEKYELNYVSCLRCGTLYVNPRPTPAILEEYYSTSENYAYWNKYIFPASEGARREKIFRPRAERVLSICNDHGIPGGTLLEVGAGFGTFCEEITRLEYFDSVIAVEPTPVLAESCRAKGLTVIEKPIEQVQLSALDVDVIASFEVIEHLFAPRGFLQSCSRAMKRHGIIVLSCPNGQGFEVATLRKASDTVDTEHLNYFNPVSLSDLAHSVGFDVIEVRTPGELDAELVRAKAIKGEFDISSQPFLRRVLLDDWERLGQAFQRFLADNLLSSHMWLVARKM
jgi:2-polyprenyl-3-methyl-5-hydroxy-6-metoxy-1,4-benzoquinol methylase/ribosomal protein S27E